MITITNNNTYKSDYAIVDYDNYDNIEVIDDGDILSHLTDTIQLGESFKFERVFDIISANIELFEIVFYSSLGGYPLLPYLKEIENSQDEKSEIDILEIHWSGDKFEDELSIFPDFHGIKNGEDISYALDFTSLNNIKHLVVKLNPNVSIIDMEKKKLKFLGNQSFSVFDFFHAILNEISFHGLPSERNERSKELTETFAELKEEEIQDLQDSEKITFEDFVEQMDSKDLYLVKHKDLRERIDPKLTNDENMLSLKKCMEKKLQIYQEIIDLKKGDFRPFYKKLTDIEFSMQTLYGEAEEKKYHKFWQTPKCTCPKIDNIEKYPSDKPIFDKKCPIHKK